MKKLKFNVGDAVEWTSQAGSYCKLKRGVVVAAVDVRSTAKDVVQGMGFSKETHVLGPIGSCGMRRDHESYLVEVNDSKSGKGKPKLYWPRVSALIPTEATR